jgi:hypothetical protein
MSDSDDQNALYGNSQTIRSHLGLFATFNNPIKTPSIGHGFIHPNQDSIHKGGLKKTGKI